MKSEHQPDYSDRDLTASDPVVCSAWIPQESTWTTLMLNSLAISFERFARTGRKYTFEKVVWKGSFTSHHVTRNREGADLDPLTIGSLRSDCNVYLSRKNTSTGGNPERRVHNQLKSTLERHEGDDLMPSM